METAMLAFTAGVVGTIVVAYLYLNADAWWPW